MTNFKQTFTTTKKSRGTNTCEYIVLHDTASTATAAANAKYLATSIAPASAHYVVGYEGEVYKIGQDDQILWHAGESAWEGRTDMNRYSIGIEIHSDGTTFTDPQRAAVKQLVRDLMQTHGIPANRVIRHKDIAPKRKSDVRDAFWQNEYATFADYQNSLTKSSIMNTLKETILLLKELHPLVPVEQRVKIEAQANDLRKVEESLGLEVTK